VRNSVRKIDIVKEDHGDERAGFFRPESRIIMQIPIITDRDTAQAISSEAARQVAEVPEK